jgi:type IX secretion system PorP/SprF family membrane protein
MYKNKSKIIQLKIVNLLFVLLFCSCTQIFAQDIHFSQLKSTPLFINPANTGTGISDFRFTNDFRNQWHTIDNPYNSLMLAFDTRVLVFNRQAGVGALLLHDQSSANFLNVDKFYLSFSHSFFVKNHQIVVGLQPGYIVKKYSSKYLTFGNQFDQGGHIFNPDLPSSEDNLEENLGYIDVNAGLLWQTRIKTLVSAVGFSVSHLNRPVESFYSDTSGSPLPMKYTLHGKIKIPFTAHYALEPQALCTFTRGGKEFNGGAVFHYYPLMQNVGLKEVYGISALRINPVKNFDALILGAGLEIAGFDLCFSYDINVSSLRKVSRYQGAYEISLVFNSPRKRNIHRADPCFML